MLIAVLFLIALALLGGPVGVVLAAGVLGLGWLISAMQPGLSRDKADYNRANAGETSTRPGPYCSCADCQDALWRVTPGPQGHWAKLDSRRDGDLTRRLDRDLRGPNVHPTGCSCLDCGDRRAGKSSRWA